MFEKASEKTTLGYNFRSTYEHAIYWLFLLECAPLTSVDGISDAQRLNSKRHEAAFESCCQRLAIPSLEAISTRLDDTRVESFWGKPGSSHGYYDLCGAPFHHRSRDRSLTEVDPSRFCGHIGANIKPCPWLSDEPGMPYYLWSVNEGRTIETMSLNEVPIYTAISHTWGRWAKLNQPVIVEGVRDWLIPENDIFDVKMLPEILRKVPVATSYIWFDLLCIPQDRSIRALEEIARQAKIFRGAKYAIAWLNMIPDWQGLKATTEWMCMHYLSYSGWGDKKSQAKNYAAATFSAASIRTGLFEPYSYGPEISRSDLEPSPWFTSLWTLQEACLRPDMLLCSRDWEMLTVGNGAPVPFDGLVILSAHVLDHAYSDPSSGTARPHRFDSTLLEIPASKKLGALVRGGQYPRGYIELFALLERTGMEDLHKINQESILKLGSQRHCKRGRAEAIMSVLGATEWYMEALRNGKLSEVEKELVLGLYPLSFLRETAKMIGARFYNSIIIRNKFGIDIPRDLAVRGSLLPFSAIKDPNDKEIPEETFVPWWFFNGGDYPSVQSWRIEADGSVKIIDAAVLAPASNGELPDYPLFAGVQLAYPLDRGLFPTGHKSEENYRLRTIDLRKWEKNWLPFSRNYAVALAGKKIDGTDHVRGILLKETPTGSLVKVGVFSTRSILDEEGGMTGIFKVQSVNWSVL